MSNYNTKKELKIIRETQSMEELTKEQKMKYEIAKELGLYEKVMKEGWQSLSAKETGKIGGKITSRKRAESTTGSVDLAALNDTMKFDDSPKL